MDKEKVEERTENNCNKLLLKRSNKMNTKQKITEYWTIVQRNILDIKLIDIFKLHQSFQALVILKLTYLIFFALYTEKQKIN